MESVILKTQEPIPAPLSAVEVIHPGSFEAENHYYPRVLNATIHPLVHSFLTLSLERLANRYCHLHPQVDRNYLEELIQYQPRFLCWAGADLFHVTTAGGARRMILIETNSSPSGQKSMPFFLDHEEEGGFRFLVRNVFAPKMDKQGKGCVQGSLAVLYDKNYMEASGYAAALASHYNEDVYLVPFFDSDNTPPVRFSDRVLEIYSPEGEWIPIRAALRYVTQRPWNRIPVLTRTKLLNPILGCLAGGRNKMVAAMAYELLNAELAGSGLSIRIPETIRDVRKAEIPLLVQKFGGFAVVKIPYSNAGQGVFTITSERELAQFMAHDYPYERFIVQSLIGNYQWTSDGKLGKFYHVGTVPNRLNNIHVADLRMMVGSTPEGFRPIAIYCRRARKALCDKLTGEIDSWDMLGTNLSIKKGTDKWESDTSRLLLMDRRDFNKLGLGPDALIDGFIQAVLGVIAIDKMASKLITQKKKFRIKLFKSINDDQALLDEITL